MKKLTKEEINKRINHRGIWLVGKYINSRTKTEFMCEYGHRWFTDSNSVNRGCGCPTCSDTKLTKEEINKRINHRGIWLVGKYINSRTKTEFMCEHGHRWFTDSSHIVNKGTGCPTCDVNNRTLTKEEINKRINHRGIWLVGKYINSQTKTEFMCEHGHRWFAKFTDVNQGKGCPTCSTGGGFDPNKPAILYYLKIKDTEIHKIGITNKTIEQRWSVDDRLKFDVVKTWDFEEGQYAFITEQAILRAFVHEKYKGYDILSSGNTELFNMNVLRIG